MVWSRRALKRIAVGISGGVDSTVAALLLKKRGYEVVGVFMRNWDLTDENGECTADKDEESASNICNRLGIQFSTVNFVKEYWNEVFTPLIDCYENGLTPNPDILCNKHIKFAHFQKFCLEQLDCDAVATGHYAQNSFGEDLEHASPDKRAKLLKSVDKVKDQTFFLAQIPQQSLQRAMFPVGGITKDIVKKIAATSGFEDVAQKKESMGICFIGKRKDGFQRFIQQYCEDKEGDIFEVESGQIIGRHQGIHQWTLGQRVRLSFTHQKVYLVSKDIKKNILNVCYGEDNPLLYCEQFFASRPHWISGQPDQLRHGNKSLECQFRFQNTQPLTNCIVSFGMSSNALGNWEYMDQQALVVSSAEPLRAVTPGQYTAFYRGDECLGAAIIDRPGPSLFTMAQHRL